MQSIMNEARRLARNPVPVHQGFWRLRIGALPVSYKEERTSVTQPFTTPAPETINANIKDFVCPGLSCSFEKEGHYKFVTRIPTQEDNQFDDAFTVSMLADNRYENYWAIRRYMDTVQRGETDAYPERNPFHRIYGIDHRYRNRLTYIPWIDIHAADDVAQEYMIFRFFRCRLAKLSDLNIKPGSIELVSFNLSVQYEFVKLYRLPDPNELMSAICVSTSSDSFY